MANELRSNVSEWFAIDFISVEDLFFYRDVVIRGALDMLMVIFNLLHQSVILLRYSLIKV